MDYEFQEFQSLFQSVLDIGGFLFTVFINIRKENHFLQVVDEFSTILINHSMI